MAAKFKYDDWAYEPSAPDYVQPAPPRWWLGPGLLSERGKLVLSALSKIGKSWLAAEMTRALTSGTVFAGSSPFHAPQAARVLYLDAELGEWSFTERWKQFDPGRTADRNLRVLRIDGECNLDEPIEYGDLAKYVDAHAFNVVVVDPINRFMNGDISNNKELKAFMRGVHHIANQNRAHGTAIVLVAHNNKPYRDANRAYDPLDPYNIQGGGTLINQVDTLLTVKRETDVPDVDVDGREFWELTLAARKMRHARAVPDFDVRICPERTPPVTYVGTTTKVATSPGSAPRPLHKASVQ